MADRQLHGNKFFFYRGNADGPPETYKVFGCSESTSLSQTLNDIVTETNCGRVVVDGTRERTVDFTIIPLLEASLGKVTIANLQGDFDAGVFLNYKITTATATTGDPIFTFSAKLNSLTFDFPAGDIFRGSGSLTISDAGVDVDFAP